MTKSNRGEDWEAKTFVHGGRRCLMYKDIPVFPEGKDTLPVIEMHGVRRRWVGIGFVSEGEPHGDELLVCTTRPEQEYLLEMRARENGAVTTEIVNRKTMAGAVIDWLDKHPKGEIELCRCDE